MPSRNVYWKNRQAIDRINEGLKAIGAGWEVENENMRTKNLLLGAAESLNAKLLFWNKNF